MVYAGVNKGEGFFPRANEFDLAIGFEADPKLCRILQETVNRQERRNIEIVNAALCNYDGEVKFNINNNDYTSSIGTINTDIHPAITTVSTINVRAVNLFNFLIERGIDHIDFYLSDLQGMDLIILKTLQPFLKEKKIITLQCEVGKDEKPPVYLDLYNKFSGFQELLSDNYRIIEHRKVESDITEDIVWRVKSKP